MVGEIQNIWWEKYKNTNSIHIYVVGARGVTTGWKRNDRR